MAAAQPGTAGKSALPDPTGGLDQSRRTDLGTGLAVRRDEICGVRVGPCFMAMALLSLGRGPSVASELQVQLGTGTVFRRHGSGRLGIVERLAGTRTLAPLPE